MTTDPDSGSAKAINPGTWNRYAYVTGDPVNSSDPTGLDGDCDGTDWLGGAYGDYCVIDGDPADNLQINPQTVMTDSEYASSVGGGNVSDTSATSDPADIGFKISIDVNGNKPQVTSTPEAPQFDIFSCAAEIGDKFSIAGGLHALGIGRSGAGGFTTDALGGNAFSGLTNLIASLKSGAAGGHNVFYNMGQGVASGPGQGVLPPGVRGPWGASPSGLATDAITKTFWSSITGAGRTLTTLAGEASLASTAITAAEFATGVAEVKYGYDALTYAAGLVACAAR